MCGWVGGAVPGKSFDRLASLSVQATCQLLLAYRFGDVGFGVDVVPGKRVEPVWGGAGWEKVWKRLGSVLVKIVGGEMTIDPNSIWSGLGHVCQGREGQAWGEVKVEAWWERSCMGGAGDQDGAKLEVRVVVRARLAG